MSEKTKEMYVIKTGIDGVYKLTTAETAVDATKYASIYFTHVILPKLDGMDSDTLVKCVCNVYCVGIKQFEECMENDGDVSNLIKKEVEEVVTIVGFLRYWLYAKNNDVVRTEQQGYVALTGKPLLSEKDNQCKAIGVNVYGHHLELVWNWDEVQKRFPAVWDFPNEVSFLAEVCLSASQDEGRNSELSDEEEGDLHSTILDLASEAKKHIRKEH